MLAPFQTALPWRSVRFPFKSEAENVYAALFVGALFGLSAGFSPGPLMTLVISQTLQHNAREGALVAASPLVTDAPIILISFFVVMAGTVYFTFTAKPVYEASALVLLKEEGQVQQQLFDYSSFMKREKMINNQVEILKSRTLAEDVIEALQKSQHADSLYILGNGPSNGGFNLMNWLKGPGSQLPTANTRTGPWCSWQRPICRILFIIWKPGFPIPVSLTMGSGRYAWPTWTA